MNTYRRHLVVNGFTGEAETFAVRISDEAFEAWLANRELLAAEGKPDRPPDVDLPEARVWVPHPGEEHHPYFAGRSFPTVDDILSAFTVLTISGRHRGADGEGRILFWIGSGPDGSFDFRITEMYPDGTTVEVDFEYPAEMDPDAVWRHIEGEVEHWVEAHEADRWRVMTYEDHEYIAGETVVALEQAKRGLMPIPESPVQ